MLYGKYMPGRKCSYVILEWKNQGHACSFWVSLYTALDSVVVELLVNFMSCGGEVCGGGGPSMCSNLQHDRKNTCQTPSKPCLSVTCEIEILTLFAGRWPLVLLENWVVLGPWVCEKQQSSLMSREMPSFLCDLKLWSRKDHLKRRCFRWQMDDGRRKRCRPYVFRLPYL